MVEAERRERRSLGLIAQVSDLLMDVDDPHALREIATILRRAVVGWAAFYLNDGGLRVADGIDAGRPPTGQGRAARRGARRARRRTRRRPAAARRRDRPTGRARARRLLRPGSASAWLAQQADERRCSRRRGRRPRLPLPTAHGRTVLVFPLPGRRRVLGVLVVRAHGGHGLRGLEPSVRTVLDLTARRVGLVIDNARLYDREHRLAETLQRAMLPEQAEVDGLDVWTYYAPNSENAQVGGDWYDVLQVSPDVVGVVIGDVVGHDVEAAAAMGQLRSVVRSYMFDITTPGPVLERVDQLVAGMRVPAAGEPRPVDADAVRRSGWRLEYSRAGSPAGAARPRGRRSPLLDAAGGPLIGFGGTPRSTGAVELRPG